MSIGTCTGVFGLTVKTEVTSMIHIPTLTCIIAVYIEVSIMITLLRNHTMS